jgi:hypothetical protein
MEKIILVEQKLVNIEFRFVKWGPSRVAISFMIIQDTFAQV